MAQFRNQQQRNMSWKLHVLGLLLAFALIQIWLQSSCRSDEAAQSLLTEAVELPPLPDPHRRRRLYMLVKENNINTTWIIHHHIAKAGN